MNNKTQKIFDKNVDCSCNLKFERFVGHCKCYCHIPIWYRNLVWKIQDTKVIGNFLIVIFMFFFQPFMEVYLAYINRKMIGDLYDRR